jgi:hypothetical protein
VAIPVSQRATRRLIRELDLLGPGDQFDEAAMKSFTKLFHSPLAPKSIAVIRAATHLAEDDMTKASAALASEETVAQAEATSA